MGLVKLGNWLEARQKQYKKFMDRVHNMIVAVTITEKEERKKVHAIQQVLQGFDPLDWIKAAAEVRSEGHLDVDYQEVQLIAPRRETIGLPSAKCSMRTCTDS